MPPTVTIQSVSDHCWTTSVAATLVVCSGINEKENKPSNVCHEIYYTVSQFCFERGWERTESNIHSHYTELPELTDALDRGSQNIESGRGESPKTHHPARVCLSRIFFFVLMREFRQVGSSIEVNRGNALAHETLAFGNTPSPQHAPLPHQVSHHDTVTLVQTEK